MFCQSTLFLTKADIWYITYMKTWKFVKKNYGYIALAVILLIVSIISFQNGKYILSNDNYSPELNPLLTIERSVVSPAWRSYRVLGFASESEQADIFRSITFWLGDFVLSKNILAQIYSLICLGIGTFSIALLTQKLAVRFLAFKNKQLIILISGIVYLTTLWTAWVFNYNMMPYVSQFAFYPLLLCAGYFAVSNTNAKTLLSLFLSGILFVSTSVIATIGLIDILLFFIFVIWLGLISKVKLKKIFIILSVFIMTQLFWILPFVEYTLNSSVDIVNSFTNRSITSNTIDLEYEMMDLSNSARFYTRLLGTTDDPVLDTFVFEDAENYLDYDFYKIVGLMPLFLSVLGLGFIVVKKNYKVLPLYIGLFGLLFLIKNKNEPLGLVYVWLQDNIPLFKQVLRWTSSKLSEGYLILLAMTSTFGFIYFITFLTSFFKNNLKKVLQFVFIASFLGVSLFYAEFLFNGNLFTERALVEFPEEYYVLEEYIQEENIQDERLIYLPPANNGYFREYEWGFIGSQFLGYVIPNPIIDMSLSIGSDFGEDAVASLTEYYNSNNYLEFINSLEKYDTEYILVDESLVKGRYGYEINWDFVNNNKENWEKVWSKDFLTLYRIENENIKYSEVLSGYDFKDIEYGSFVREVSTTPKLEPLSINLQDSEIRNGYIYKEMDYQGMDTYIYLDADNQIEFPSRIKIDDTLIVSPAFPVVNNVEGSLYREYSIGSGYIGYIMDNNFMKQEIADRSFYNEYSSVNSLYGVSPIPKRYSLLKDFSNTTPGACSGGEFFSEPNLELEENNLGFSFVSDTDLPCLYHNVSDLIIEDSVLAFHVNWESEQETWFGFCMYSEIEERCLNDDKFFQTMDGYGDIEIILPRVVNKDDNINLTIYSFSPVVGEKELLIRDLGLEIYSDFEELELIKEETEFKQIAVDIQKDSIISLEVPILYGGSSYRYSKNSLWLANIANDESLNYDILFNEGQEQTVIDNYINQYKNLFSTEVGHKYLWIFEGENTSNIPSTLCLTYQGDDKCISADLFSEGINKVASHSFYSNSGSLDISYNSTSFKAETTNILKEFVIMEIPNSWLGLSYVSSVSTEYSEFEMSGSSVLYQISGKDISQNKYVVSIPQASASGWIGFANTSSGIKVLNKDNKVRLDGWKQGWDVSNLDFNNIYVLYYPNLLAYLGYALIVVTGIVLIFKLVKEKKYGSK